MFNHEPPGYDCPFCKLLAGDESEYNQQADIVFQDELTTATIAPTSWVNNIGHVLVLPNTHAENIYDINDEVLAGVYRTVKIVARAIRQTYDCDGISTRQHNEPAGDQDVWHFHVHVFPRYENDHLYQGHEEKVYIERPERAEFAKLLRNYIANN